ncbi:MAG: nucleotidyltransferase family protein [Cyanobacteria bacterium J06635_15]
MVENQLLWLCTRKDFSSTHRDKATAIIKQGEVDWDNIYDTALKHNVASIMFANLLKLREQGISLPKELIKKHIFNFSRHLNYRKNLLADIENILEYFNQKSVDILLAKGTALDLTVYRDSVQYTPGDIDLLLKNNQENVSAKEDEADIRFFKGLNYYPEWERSEHHDLSINGLLPIDFNYVWKNAFPIEVGNNNLKTFVMCPEDMLLFTCINACRKRYFRLKSVCDIAEIIYFYPNLSWDKLVKDAKIYQCKNIVYTALLVTQNTVSCNIPKTIFEDLKINPIRAFLIRKLVNFLHDNFPLSELSSSVENRLNKIDLTLLLVTVTYTSPQILKRAIYLYEKIIICEKDKSIPLQV